MNLATFHFLFDRLRRRFDKLRDHGHVDTSGSLNPVSETQGLFCPNPFTQLDVYEGGKAYSCCSSWLPTPLGSLRHESLDAVWNSPASQAIRESIHDGSFRYCNHQVCPAIQGGTLPTLAEARQNPRYRDIIEHRRLRIEDRPVFINLCNDASCNLYCPSCRRGRVIHAKGPEYEKRQHLQDLITQQLFSEPTDRDFCLNITGSGDPFASPVFRNFLFNLEGRDFPNLKIQLQTNGVLLTPSNWRRMRRIHRNIQIILVSFDAATETTYKTTRAGGNWKILLENVRRLGRLRQSGELRFLRLDFVVQQANFREMGAFVQLARELGADRAAFSMVLDWGTWTREQYRHQCVWKTDHPEFEDFMQALRDPALGEEMVMLGNLTEYRQRALAASA